MLGGHTIKTLSCSQGAYALSSAETELYAMVEAVARAEALRNFAVELGLRELENVVKLGTDSSAAKSFVCGRGFGACSYRSLLSGIPLVGDISVHIYIYPISRWCFCHMILGTSKPR